MCKLLESSESLGSEIKVSTLDDYKHAMDMVKRVEEGPPSKFSAETRCFADLVRAVDNYHRETQKRADWLQAELTELKGKMAGMPRPILGGDGKQGWMLDYKQILVIYEVATMYIEPLSMEQTEAVMLAMINEGFTSLDKKSL